MDCHRLRVAVISARVTSTRRSCLSFDSRFSAASIEAAISCIPLLLVLLLLLISPYARSQEIDPAQAERYHALIDELRCLVCQNESLAESNADLAEDLRAEIREMMRQGATDAQIIDFLVARYGDFVLYRPPFKPITYLLWFAPLVLAIAGLAVLGYKIRGRARQHDPPLSAQEQRRLREVLGENNGD
jgi:cytochrome c-type biogenesis protein CcmH